MRLCTHGCFGRVQLCDPVDYSLPGFSIREGLLQARMKLKVKSLSHVRLFATPWTVAYQDPPSMGFSRQKCWSGLPFPSPGDLPDPRIKPGYPVLRADALPSEPPRKPGPGLVTKPHSTLCDSLDCSTPGSSVLCYLPEFAQIHVH